MTITPTPFEQMLEDLAAAQREGDVGTAVALKAIIEADLAIREQKVGLR